ncbi:MAG: sigma factor [Acidobacteriota bacterium]
MTDADAFEQFVREYQDIVYATAGRLLGSVADAEDVAQGVFLKAFQNFAEISNSPTAAGSRP